MAGQPLTKTKTEGIFRRHKKGCPGNGKPDSKHRCNCPYVVSVRHDGQQHWKSVATFDLAKAERGKRDTGDTAPVSKITFGSYFTDWIETYAGRTKRGFEEETRKEYRRSIEDDALPLWKNKPLAKIGVAEIRRLYNSMREAGKSHAAMKKTRAALSPLFNTAIEDEIISVNPVIGVKIPAPQKASAEDEDDERGKALTREELAAFLAVVDPDWRMFFEFLTVTGLRIGEAIGLRWKNVVLTGDPPRVRVREQIYEGRRKAYLKSDDGKREIPLTSAWVDRLLVHRRDTFKGEDAPVFASTVGTPLVPGNVYRRVLAPAAIDAGLYVQVGPEAEGELVTVTMGKSGRRHRVVEGADRALCGRKGSMSPIGDTAGAECALCREAEAKRARQGRKTAIAFHAFRHTCASLLFDEDRNVKQVAEWLGHSDPAFTMRVYISLLDDGLGEGLELAPASANARPLQGVIPSVSPKPSTVGA